MLRRCVHLLAFAGQPAVAEGDHRADGPVHGADEMSMGIAGHQRRAVRLAGDVQVARERPDGDVPVIVVPIRAFLPEAADGGEDDSRVDLAEHGVAEADAFQVAGREGLDDDVGGLHELLEDTAAIRRLDIEGDAPLVGVEGEPVEALLRVRLVMVERAPVATRVAARRLDLDHVGAEVSHRPGAQIAFIVGQVKNAVATEHAPS